MFYGFNERFNAEIPSSSSVVLVLALSMISYAKVFWMSSGRFDISEWLILIRNGNTGTMILCREIRLGHCGPQ